MLVIPGRIFKSKVNNGFRNILTFYLNNFQAKMMNFHMRATVLVVGFVVVNSRGLFMKEFTWDFFDAVWELRQLGTLGCFK